MPNRRLNKPDGYPTPGLKPMLCQLMPPNGETITCTRRERFDAFMKRLYIRISGVGLGGRLLFPTAFFFPDTRPSHAAARS